jgi:EAL domain-containing protein (putative c-di-GMP-specific phosphodiesterase class I)/DNA-binding response OmpR family regulator
LIIADSADSIPLLLWTLRQEGYDPIYEQVETADALTAALERQPWDLVLADYLLPRFRGLDALCLLQEQGLDLPVIIVSRQISERTAVTAMRAGAVDYLRKSELARLALVIERELRAARTRCLQHGLTQELCEPPEQGHASNNAVGGETNSVAPSVVGLGHKEELRQAIETEQLLLYYQPQVSLPSGAVTRVEALVRWRHPEHGVIPPDHFIPLAEYTGLIHPLSRWVLNAALGQGRIWHEAHPQLRIAVNLSMHNLHDPQLVDTITRLLDTWAVPPTGLTVEITESTLAADPVRVQATLTQLRAMGIQIAIDDFGTGYSSLAALRRLPVDEIKIDKSFVLGMTGEDNNAVLVRAIIDLGHTLGLQVVAEGVEDREAYDLLVTLGCDLVQGYYVSCPLPATEFTPWLEGTTVGIQSASETLLTPAMQVSASPGLVKDGGAPCT